MLLYGLCVDVWCVCVVCLLMYVCVLFVIDCVMLNGSFSGCLYCACVCECVCCFDVGADCVFDLLCDGALFSPVFVCVRALICL